MNSRQSVGYHSIVAALSPKNSQQPAAIRAANVASKLNSQVTLAHIATQDHPDSLSTEDLDRLKQSLSESHPEIVLVKHQEGNWLDLVPLSAEVSGDLIVIDNQVNAALTPLLEQNVEALCDKGDCDVLVVSSEQYINEPPGDYGHIMVAADLSDEGLMTIYKAVRMAKRYAAKLTLLNVVEQDPERDEAKSAEECKLRLRGLEACTAVIEGLEVDKQVAIATQGIEQAVTAFATQQECDLVVIGSHRFNGICVLLGGTASGVIKSSQADILVVHE